MSCHIFMTQSRLTMYCYNVVRYVTSLALIFAPSNKIIIIVGVLTTLFFNALGAVYPLVQFSCFMNVARITKQRFGCCTCQSTPPPLPSSPSAPPTVPPTNPNQISITISSATSSSPNSSPQHHSSSPSSNPSNPNGSLTFSAQIIQTQPTQSLPVATAVPTNVPMGQVVNQNALDLTLIYPQHRTI